MSNDLTLNKLFQAREAQIAACRDRTFVGIDFGTSTTVVSIATIADDGTIKSTTTQLPQLLPDGAFTSSDLLPTVIASPSPRQLLVGQGAYKLKWNPQYKFGINIWYAFKMELGKDLGPRWFESRQDLIKSPQDATRLFFKYLHKAIEEVVRQNHLPATIKYAVSVPASFESNQRKDLLEALSVNQYDVLEQNLIDEPNAAFLGYINKDYFVKEPIYLPTGHNPKVLVFDFGAGTCDISILEISADFHGMHTRNISISQFTELGGNDIDKYIVTHFLLPDILTLNGKSRNDYTSAQLDVIGHQLLGIAEKLKIQVCKDLEYLITDTTTLQQQCDEGKGRTVTIDTNIYTDYGDLHQKDFTLTYKEFVETMQYFYNDTTCKEKNINAVISSAIEKAKLQRSDIDYVMMIGGSSRNPFVQEMMRHYFGKATRMLIPQNMQNLVSQGAAIHSLLLHGLGFTAVDPITSEPIVLVVEDEKEVPVIPAGTQIPFTPVKFDKIGTGHTPRSTIEVPICVTNAKKMVCMVKIEAPTGELLPPDERITLTISMSADKLLCVKATCAGSDYEAHTENPFANTPLTDNDIKIMKAQRESNVSANENGGRPTREALDKLCQAYEDADQDYKAAEVLVEKLAHYPKSVSHNRIGVLYHNGGDHNRAISYFRQAINADEGNYFAWANLGNDYKIIGRYEEAKKALMKAITLKADYAIPHITLGDVFSYEGDKESAHTEWEQAYNILVQEWGSGSMDECTCGWFKSLARKTEHFAMADEVERCSPHRTKNDRYNLENLATLTND